MTSRIPISRATAGPVQTDFGTDGAELLPSRVVPPPCGGAKFQGAIDCATWVVMGFNLVGLLMLAGIALLHVGSEIKAIANEQLDSPRAQEIVTSPWFQQIERSQAFQDAIAIGGLIP